jgi:hypothetical protein
MALFLDQLLRYVSIKAGTRPRPLKGISEEMIRVPVLIALYSDPHKREPFAYVEAAFWKFHPYEKRVVNEETGIEISPEMQAELIIGCCVPGLHNNEEQGTELQEKVKTVVQTSLTKILFPSLPVDFRPWGEPLEVRAGSHKIYKEKESPTFDQS